MDIIRQSDNSEKEALAELRALLKGEYQTNFVILSGYPTVVIKLIHQFLSVLSFL